MSSFSEIAEEKMLALEANYTKTVGRELYKSQPAKYKDYIRTDCITFSINVLSHAFKQLGNIDAAKQVVKHGKYGTELAKYLVEKHGWLAIYVSSDVYHPYDGAHSHGLSYYIAKNKCVYKGIPVSYFAINFKPTIKPEKSFWEWVSMSGEDNPFYKGVYWHLRDHKNIETRKDLVGLEEIKKIKFGFGVSRGGDHTWLYSFGKVHEAHYDKVESEIYEAKPLIEWGWIDNVIVVPAEEKASLLHSALTTCSLP